MDGGSPDGTKKRRKAPQWAHWAYPLVYELRKLWTWLHGQPVNLLAATLGARLGERWTAGMVVDFVDRVRGGRALPVVIHSPVGLLRDLLEEALTGDLQPPVPARRRDEHDHEVAERRRAAVAAEAEARRSAVEAARAEHAEKDATAAAARTGGLALARAVLAVRRGGAEDGPDGWPHARQPGSGRPGSSPVDERR